MLHVTPATYSLRSIIGGGEKIVLYADLALHRAARESGLALTTSVLSFGAERGTAYSDRDVRYEIIPGRPWDALSVDANDLLASLCRADVIYIHQCLCSVGILVASHARLLGRRVVGIDHGGGEYPLLYWNTETSLVFDAFHAQSEFAAASFRVFDAPVHVIPGPVDTEMFVPPAHPAREMDLVVALGRIMPHKGFDRIIKALPPGLRLVIVGQPYDADYVRDLQELSRGKDVTLRSDLDDQAVRALLQRAGLFVHASTHTDYRGTFHQKPELLGLAPLEALSSGLPALVSGAGSLPELARLPGCLCFKNDRELAEMLLAHEAGALPRAAEAEMHAAVDARYGPLPCGRQLLAVLGLA